MTNTQPEGDNQDMSTYDEQHTEEYIARLRREITEREEETKRLKRENQTITAERDAALEDAEPVCVDLDSGETLYEGSGMGARGAAVAAARGRRAVVYKGKIVVWSTSRNGGGGTMTRAERLARGY